MNIISLQTLKAAVHGKFAAIKRFVGLESKGKRPVSGIHGNIRALTLLQFPMNFPTAAEIDSAARTALTALGHVAICLMDECGSGILFFRSLPCL